MATYKGSWKFNNTMHHKHGSSGADTVEADNEVSARERICVIASRRLFDTSMMCGYFTVSNIEKVGS